MYRFLLTLLIAVSSCVRDKPAYVRYVVNASLRDSVTMQTDMIPTGWSKPDKLFITGNFDGDGQTDTLREHLLSLVTHTEVDSVPDSLNIGWDVRVRWYYEREIETYVAFTTPGHDTLFLGNSGGLYCLINVGDLNKDGKDEIALSRDNLDFSNVGSCRIYSMCKGKWEWMKRIEIFELAFWDDSVGPVPTYIPGFLEKHNGRWMFSDYEDQMRADTEEDLKMRELKIDRCK